MNPFTAVTTLITLNGVRQTLIPNYTETIKANSGYDNLHDIQPFEDLVNQHNLPLINIDELSSDELHLVTLEKLNKLFTD